MIRFAGSNGAMLRKRCRPSPSITAITAPVPVTQSMRLQSSNSSAREQADARHGVSSTNTSRLSAATNAPLSEKDKILSSTEIMRKFFSNRPAVSTNAKGNLKVSPPSAGLSKLVASQNIWQRNSNGAISSDKGGNQSKKPPMSITNMQRKPDGLRLNRNNNNKRQSSPRRDSSASLLSTAAAYRKGLDLPDFLQNIQQKPVETNSKSTMSTHWNSSKSATTSITASTTALPSRLEEDTGSSPVSDFIRKMQLGAPASNISMDHRRSSILPPSNNDSLATANPTAGVPELRSLPLPPLPTDRNDSSTTLSLTDFIRKMQEDHEKKQKEMKDRQPPLSAMQRQAVNNNFNNAEPLPKWRMFRDSNVSLRDLRKQERGHRQRPVPNFGQQEQERYVRPVYVNPKKQPVTIPSYPVSLAEASLLFREKTRVLLRKLKQLGETTTASKSMMIEPETMELMALQLKRKVELAEAKADMNDDAILVQRRMEQEAAAENGYDALPPRAPVVTIMGHVDHGKTTLMDNLRRRSLLANAANGGTEVKKKSKKAKTGKAVNGSSDVAGTEAGGITQVISAFQVPLDGMDQAVTFLDTPGHAAFKAMRQSGSDAADIIVLVVAADDGVSKQTIEILDFYKSIVKEAGENGISLVVAMNKIDKPGIDVDESRRKIETQLQEQGIQVEGIPSQYGTESGLPVEIYPVSGLTGEGLDDFIEGLALQAEVMDLRADDSTRAEGLVMDARVDKGVGIVVDTIVRWGSIRKGDVVVSGTAMGKVRLLKDMSGQAVKQGLPSQPVRIIGFDAVPKAGDPVMCVESEEAAHELVERRKAIEIKNDRAHAVEATEAELQSSGKHLLHHEWREMLETKHGIESESATVIRVPVIIKADADGTLAAVREALMAVGEESTHNLIVDPVRVGVGPVLASDIQLAKEGGATIFAFNLKHEQTIASMADEEKVKLVTSKVIYSLLEDAKVEYANYLPAIPVEVVHGRGKVQAVFEIGGISDKVAGLRVIEGTLFRDKATRPGGPKLKSEYRILRNGKVLSDATYTVSSLKYFKEDVNEVARGKECGLSLAGYSLFEEGDEIECFSIEMKREFV
ncbi:hypothetical protein MPSEU_000807200 [Mayamaea pseudoterrestris]|nr:hypothetical protein MPSEU_000807200 [Mayamaea pseudoterrestris]